MLDRSLYVLDRRSNKRRRKAYHLARLALTAGPSEEATKTAAP